MGQVRALQVAQAWLAAALARATGQAAHARRARSLASKVEADPNRMGAPYAASLRELRAWLDGG